MNVLALFFLFCPQQTSGLALPLELVTYLEDPKPLAQMGAALDVQGNYLFIGCPGDGKGRVDVRYRVKRGPILVQRLTLPTELATTDNQFGRSLAADGSVLVVGTSTHAIVFRRSPEDLLYYAAEILGGGSAGSRFAERLAVIEGELVAVCAQGELAVEVFEADTDGKFPSRSTHVLTPVSTGTTPDMTWMTSFGSNVGLHRASDGSVSILVGMQDACYYQRPAQVQAPDEEVPNEIGATAARTGGVAVVRKTDGEWKLAQRLIPDWSKMKNFGFEVCVDGDRAAVGAIYSRVFSNGLDAGTASVYRWDGTQFVLVKTTWPSVPAQNGLFGSSVDLCGDFLVVGQPHHWGGPAGLVEAFQIMSNDLLRVGVIKAPDGNGASGANALGDCFGLELVTNVYGEVLVAAPFSAPNTGTPPLYAGGALYLFR